MEDDESFLKILAVGLKNDTNYLQHLVDSYFRDRSKNKNSHKLEVSAWAMKHKHFGQLKQIQGANSRNSAYRLAETAVQSYSNRICPKLMLSPFYVINDSIEVIVQYIVLAIEWIGRKIADKNWDVCPFQFDLCLGMSMRII